MQSKKDKLEKANFMEDVFRIISDEWSNYEEVKGMIGYFGDEKDKQRLKVYEDCIKEYLQQKVSKGVMYVIVGGGGKLKEDERMTVKIHEKPTRCEPDMISGTLLLPCWVYLENTLQSEAT